MSFLKPAPQSRETLQSGGSVGASYAPADIECPINGGGFINLNANIGLGLDLGTKVVSGQVNYQYSPIVIPLLKL